MFRCALLWLLGCVALVLSGCGEKAVKVVPVSGTVTIQDAPLPYGNITLVPDAANGNQTKLQPRGTIGADGKYTLESDGKPGAPLGKYLVGISAVKPSKQEDGYKPSERAASQDYMDASKSGLTLEVVENPAPGAYDVKLTKK
jgi:hypothetical protein